MSCKILLIGYGNPGRLDDGLGPACAAMVEKLGLANVSIDADYQLTVEDAADVANYDVVIFADALLIGDDAFVFKELEACREISFSTHSVNPGEVLALARDMFNAGTRGYMLGIRGYEFNEFGEGLSERAQCNLREAVAFLEKTIQDGSFERHASERAVEDDKKPSIVFTITQGDLN